MSEKLNVLYLPSTPLNLLVAVAHALAYKSIQNARLILIDQTNVDDNPYIKALNAWDNSPFVQIEIMSGQAQGLAKFKERKLNFQRLADVQAEFKPDVLAVGSDRRVEFQYLAHVCQQRGSSAQCWYLDDGYYSYAGKPYKWYKDVVNGVIKKLVYGFWWQEPPTIGASGLIDKAWLFRPELAHERLKTKPLDKIACEWFHSEAFAEFAKVIFDVYQIDEGFIRELQKLDVLWVLPHPADYAEPALRDQVDELLDRAYQAGLKIGVKYHPRFTEKDTFSYQDRYQALLMPNSIAFEFLIPLLAKRVLMLSGLGTSLMTAIWLGEELNVKAIISPNSETGDDDQALYQAMGIPVYTDCQQINVQGSK